MFGKTPKTNTQQAAYKYILDPETGTLLLYCWDPKAKTYQGPFYNDDDLDYQSDRLPPTADMKADYDKIPELLLDAPADSASPPTSSSAGAPIKPGTARHMTLGGVIDNKQGVKHATTTTVLSLNLSAAQNAATAFKNTV